MSVIWPQAHSVQSCGGHGLRLRSLRKPSDFYRRSTTAGESLVEQKSSIQNALRVEFLLQFHHLRPQVAVVSLPLVLVELDPAGEVAFPAHHHGALAGHVEMDERLIDKVLRKGGQ